MARLRQIKACRRQFLATLSIQFIEISSSLFYAKSKILKSGTKFAYAKGCLKVCCQAQGITMNAAQTLDLIPHKLIYLKSREEFVTFLQDQGVPTKKMQDVERLQRYGQELGISIFDNF
jgi:hypothetical protein